MVKEIKVVNNDLAVLNTLRIGHEEDGTVYVENFEVVRDTLESLLEGKDKIIVTTEENSVKAAQDASTKLNNAKKEITKVFADEEQRLKNELSKLTQPKKELLHCFDSSTDNIKMQVMYAKEQWKLQAIEDNQRDCSIDLTAEMFSKIKPTMRMSKKKIVDDVMLRVQEIEKEFEQRQKDEDTLEQCCRIQELDFEHYRLLLDTNDLATVLDIIAQDQERKREQERQAELEAEKRKKQEEEIAKQQQAREVIETQVVPVLEDVTPVEIPDILETGYDAFGMETPEFEPIQKWCIQITTTRSKQLLLKQFCQENGIEVSMLNGNTSNSQMY